MRKILIAGIALAVMSSVAYAKTIRLGTEAAYPPYNLVNDKGEIDGFERELGDKLCEIAKLECTWVKNDWDSIIPNLVSGNYDAIVAAMTITPERDEKIDFTEAYFPPSPSAYVALKDSKPDLAKGNIAAQINTVQSAFVAESGATLVEYASPDETVEAVRKGEAEAVLADKGYLEKIVKESNGELVFVGDEVRIGKGIGIGVRESDDELEQKLSAAIKPVKEDGTLNALIEKWFEGMKGPY